MTAPITRMAQLITRNGSDSCASNKIIWPVSKTPSPYATLNLRGRFNWLKPIRSRSRRPIDVADSKVAINIVTRERLITITAVRYDKSWDVRLQTPSAVIVRCAQRVHKWSACCVYSPRCFSGHTNAAMMANIPPRAIAKARNSRSRLLSSEPSVSGCVMIE